MASLKLHQAINAFALSHRHLTEPEVIKSLNKEMPNWDLIISNKFIIFCMNREVIPPDIDGTFWVEKQANGYHVIKIEDISVDWAVHRHTPGGIWPGVSPV